MLLLQKNCIQHKIAISIFSCKQSLRKGDSSSFLLLHDESFFLVLFITWLAGINKGNEMAISNYKTYNK